MMLFFLFSTPFFTYKNKKTKIILAFFTISSKITLADEKRARKAPRTFCEKRNENILLKSSVRNHEMKFLQSPFTFFFKGNSSVAIWSYILDVSVHSLLFVYTCK